jgi:hypothetical protein
MTEKQELKFNRICYKLRIYDPEFGYDSQCNDYKKLKELVESGIPAATNEEYMRWDEHPTQEELDSPTELKYLTFLHPNLAKIFRIDWESIIKFINS